MTAAKPRVTKSRVNFVERVLSRRLPRDEQSWLREAFGALWWQGYGNCATTGGDLHFPEKGDPAEPAKRVCAACIVSDVCLEWALSTGQEWGVWGGHTTDERREMRGMVRRYQPTGGLTSSVDGADRTAVETTEEAA